MNRAARCQDTPERAVVALAALAPSTQPATGRRPPVVVTMTLRYECTPIPPHLAQASCVTLNRRWIHPCHVIGACFAVAEGYACPICKLTFERQRDGERVYEVPT